MKYLLGIFTLEAILISLQAAPMRNAWFEVVQAEKLVKGVGDIWSHCSECSKFIRMILGVFFFLIVAICTVVLNCSSSAVKPVAK